MRYADAGVNISVADEAKRRIAAMAGKTFRRGVLAPIGGFGSLFQLDRKRWRDPVLVASCDGVGTKLKVAFATGIHSTVGADILNHCVNDILTQGAEPLFFLDYLAMGKLDTRIVEQVIEGMSRAAKQAGCALIGGETAEMPDVYAPGEYDLAGFIVGAVERKKMLDPRRVRPGDVLLALPSSGLHTNGYSLARKLVFDVAKLEPDTYVAEVGNKIGAELLKPHRAYWPLLKNILARGWVSSMAHITGGGITGNLPRALPRERAGGRRAGLVAGAADFPLSRAARKDRAGRTAEDIQSRRGNDSGGSGEASFARRSGIEAPPRKILSDRPHRERRARQTSRGLFGRVASLKCGFEMSAGRTPQAGEIAAEFELLDSTGARRRLSDLVATGPRIFIFYRGHW